MVGTAESSTPRLPCMMRNESFRLGTSETVLLQQVPSTPPSSQHARPGNAMRLAVVLFVVALLISSVRGVLGAELVSPRVIQLPSPPRPVVRCLSGRSAAQNLWLTVRLAQGAKDLSDDVPRGLVSLRLRGNGGGAYHHVQGLQFTSVQLESRPHYELCSLPWSRARPRAPTAAASSG